MIRRDLAMTGGMTLPASSGRAPQQRVLRNDERILDATFDTLSHEGWAGLTFTSVARRAGLSRRPVQERYETLSDLMSATWMQRSHPRLMTILESVLIAVGALGTQPDEDAAVDLLTTLALPDPDRTGVMESLLMAQFDPLLRHTVDETLGVALRVWLEPDVLNGSLAARRSYAISLALGLMLNSHRPAVERFAFGGELHRITRALSHPTEPRPLPAHDASYMDEPIPFATGDPTRDVLLSAVLDEVGERGFDGTSIERIVRRAGTSQGALFARFPSKQALFLEATHRQNAASMRANEEFMSGIATAGSVGAGEAAFLRVAQLPQRAKDAAYLLEQVRLSWRDSELLDARSRELAAFEDEYVRDHQQHHPAQDVSDLRAAVHVGSSIGLGILIPPMFVPWAHELPFDVVTVALMG